MRILVGTKGGLYVVRWVHGERAAQVEESHFGGDDVRAIVPEISGRAWITGTHQFMQDPDDPWPEGYRVSDTWPRM